MVTRSISLATGLVSLAVFLASQLFSNDPLFLFISSGLIVNILIVGLSAIAVYVSFQKKFSGWYGFFACSVLAVVLMASGLLGVFYSDSIHSLFSAMLPFDYILTMQCGIIFGICALSYEHAAMPASVRARLKSLPALPRPTFVLPVPKTLHPPMIFRRMSGGILH